jgi:Holliday junction resolvase
MERLEKHFQQDVIKFLNDKRIFFMRTQMGTKSGYPDLIVCNNGDFVGIELKREDGKGVATQQQHLVGQKIRMSGGQFYIISSLEQLKEALNI